MLDRATIDRLSGAPEKNAPMLNVALAEEGHAAALLSLARSHAVGPEALDVVAGRIAREGEGVGRDPLVPAEDFISPQAELDRLLVAHPRAPGAVRDAVLERHPRDPWFVLAAACHPQATPGAVLRAVEWPAASPAHDRPRRPAPRSRGRPAAHARGVVAGSEPAPPRGRRPRRA